MDNTNELAETLLRWIKEAGINQSELARRDGVSKQVVNDYLNHKRIRPDAKVLGVLAQALRQPPEYLYRAAEMLSSLPLEESEWEEFRSKLALLTPENPRRILKLIDLEYEIQHEKQNRS